MKHCLPVLFFLFLQLTIVYAREFQHPGLLHNQDDLLRIQYLVKQQQMPAIGSFEKLVSLPHAKLDYKMQGPFRYIGRRNTYEYTKYPCETDFNAAYYHALLWNITEDLRHADKAMEIIRAYAQKLEKIVGPDDPLCAGLQGFILINAAEIMRYTYRIENYSRGWTEEDTKLTTRMFMDVFQPILTTFYERKPYTNGNWGSAVNKMQMAIGIFTDNEKLYQKAIDFFLYAKDNGSLNHYIAETGQLQETGRDQAHCMLGLGNLTEQAECAWKQGDNLYGALNNRLLAGSEYLAKVNLGFTDIPYKVWKDVTGKYSKWESISKEGLGEFRPVFEIAYNHYTERKSIEMPYTKMALQQTRPEGPGFASDNPGFGTLLFFQGDSYKKASKGEIDEQLAGTWEGWKAITPTLQPVGEELRLISEGFTMEKKDLLYEAKKQPYLEICFTYLPPVRNKTWLCLVRGNEQWLFNEDEAIQINEHTFRFRIKGKRSLQKTKFSSTCLPTTIQLKFGCIDGVAIAYIQSKP